MLLLILIAVVLSLPFILALAAFIVAAVAILLLLARLGVLPRIKTSRYTSIWEETSDRRSRRNNRNFNSAEETAAGWYQSTQEGETITLPETALKKEVSNERDGG
jgi:hypothetical protein